MPRHFRFLSLVLPVLCAGVPAAQAALKVLATTPDWGSLVTELGGDKVNVYTATSPFQDVHRVDAKPSLVARARSADLVVATGADLEIGWMPVLLQDSGNSRIQPGAPGYFEAAPLVPLLEVPSAVDRSMGDIHGGGHLQQRHERGGLEIAGCTGLDLGIARVLQQHRHPADLQVRAGDDHEIGAARPGHETRFGVHAVHVLKRARRRVDVDLVATELGDQGTPVGCGRQYL